MFPPAVHRAADVWRLSPSAAVVTGIGCVVYIVWRWRVPADPERASRATVAAGATIVSVLVYSSSFLERDAMEYESVHMASHLYVLLIIAPLSVIACSTRSHRDGRRPHIAALLANPILCFALFSVVVPLFHLTHLGADVMTSAALHDVEIGSFYFVGVLFWRLVYSLDDRVRFPLLGQRAAYVALAIPVMVFSGLALRSMNHPFVMMMGAMGNTAARRDVHQAGTVMIVLGGGVLAGYATALVGQWLFEEAARARIQRRPFG